MGFYVTMPAPDTEPVTLTQAKAQVQVVAADSTWNDTLNGFVATARAAAERITGVLFARRADVQILCDSFDDLDRLIHVPVVTISSIQYVDVNGATQTLASSVYELRATEIEASVVLKFNQTWPAIQVGSRITITATVGFDEPPPEAVTAILLRVGQLFKDREEPPNEDLIAAVLVNLRRNA